MRWSFPLFLRLLLVSVLLFTCAYVVVAWQIVEFGRQPADTSADAAVVLGAAAWGGRPSPVYRERIIEAIALYKAGKVHWIILTGGTPNPGYPSEAQVGQRFCVAHGVPIKATLVDQVSRTTWQNLEQTRTLMASHNIETVLLVSDPMHMRRAVAMAHALGIRASPMPTPSSRFRSLFTRSKFLWRETWLYLAYLAFGVKAQG